MKAFQLKIMIKESHPPIWRRVIVPAGLSFSQLTVILNITMGWSGYHLSDYEFKDENLRIIDDPDGFDFSFGDEIDASDTCIDDFLYEGDWFNYVYDFGDYWQHRLEVEKIIDDYDKNYPEVVKFKGDTPWEDCGGIYGYYDKLETLKNPDSPLYEEIFEWTGGKTEPYDLVDVNKKLSKLYLSDKQHKPMVTGEIYEDYFKGNPLYTIEFESVSCEDIDSTDFFEEVSSDMDSSHEEIVRILDKSNLNKADKDFIIEEYDYVCGNALSTMLINELIIKKLEEVMGKEETLKYVESVYEALEKVSDEIDE